MTKRKPYPELPDWQRDYMRKEYRMTFNSHGAIDAPRVMPAGGMEGWDSFPGGSYRQIECWRDDPLQDADDAAFYAELFAKPAAAKDRTGDGSNP